MTDGNEVETDAVESTGPDGPAADAHPPAGAPDGYVRMRRALLGVGLLWLAAVAAVGAVLAAAYGTRASPAYLGVAVAATALSAGAGYASLRTFGYA